MRKPFDYHEIKADTEGGNVTFRKPDDWVLWISILLYVGCIVWLIIRRQPMRVGAVMVVASVLPLLGQCLFDQVEEGEFVMPGFAFLAMFLTPPALLVVTGGIVAAIGRAIRRAQ